MWCNLAFSGDEVRVPLLKDLDPWGEIAAAYGMSGEHAGFVLDAHSEIRRHVGAMNSASTNELIAALTAFAPRSCRPEKPQRPKDPHSDTKRVSGSAVPGRWASPKRSESRSRHSLAAG